MPVVSVQNLFFGEFLVTQLSGRHPKLCGLTGDVLATL